MKTRYIMFDENETLHDVVTVYTWLSSLLSRCV